MAVPNTYPLFVEAAQAPNSLVDPAYNTAKTDDFYETFKHHMNTVGETQFPSNDLKAKVHELVHEVNRLLPFLPEKLPIVVSPGQLVWFNSREQLLSICEFFSYLLLPIIPVTDVSGNVLEMPIQIGLLSVRTLDVVLKVLHYVWNTRAALTVEGATPVVVLSLFVSVRHWIGGSLWKLQRGWPEVVELLGASPSLNKRITWKDVCDASTDPLHALEVAIDVLC